MDTKSDSTPSQAGRGRIYDSIVDAFGNTPAHELGDGSRVHAVMDGDRDAPAQHRHPRSASSSRTAPSRSATAARAWSAESARASMYTFSLGSVPLGRTITRDPSARR